MFDLTNIGGSCMFDPVCFRQILAIPMLMKPSNHQLP